MTEGISIKGGAGPAEAAAIAAVIAKVVSDENDAIAEPGRQPRMSDWVMAARQQPFMPPRTPAPVRTRA